MRWRWLPNSRTRGQLTLQEPDRLSGGPIYYLGPAQYYSVERFETNTDNIRNVVYVAYGPTDARAYISAKVDASIARFRFPRMMWLEESSESPLQTEAEARRLADAALQDLFRPRESAVVKMPYCPLFEIGDAIVLLENDKQIKEQMLYAVTGIRHDISDGGITTALTLYQDAPTSSIGRWKSLETRAGVKYF